MHIKHDKGETIINDKGGWDMPSKKHPRLTSLPKYLCKPYRKIIRNFLKRAGRAAVRGASGGIPGIIISVVVGTLVEIAIEEAMHRLTESTNKMREGFPHARIGRWLD